MGQIIADVAKDSPTKHSCRCIPVVEEHCVCELVEWGCQSDKKCGRHDKAILVHWNVVVNTVKEEMGSDTDAIVR